jgi:hypothetical protein
MKALAKVAKLPGNVETRDVGFGTRPNLVAGSTQATDFSGKSGAGWKPE